MACRFLHCLTRVKSKNKYYRRNTSWKVRWLQININMSIEMVDFFSSFDWSNILCWTIRENGWTFHNNNNDVPKLFSIITTLRTIFLPKVSKFFSLSDGFNKCSFFFIDVDPETQEKTLKWGVPKYWKARHFLRIRSVREKFWHKNEFE